jgi:hypothetical protein
MREELVEPGPRWEAALRYLGLPTSTRACASDLAEIVLAVVDTREQLVARLDGGQRPPA